MKHRQQRCQRCDRNWTNKRNKLERARQYTHHQSAREPQQRKTQRTNDPDEQARSQLCANVSSERVFDVLEKLVATPAPATARQHQQRGTSKTLSVLQ